jgi:hypothetical protein
MGEAGNGNRGKVTEALRDPNYITRTNGVKIRTKLVPFTPGAGPKGSTRSLRLL